MKAADELVTLAAGPLRLVLNPALGGSIARFDHVRHGRSVPVLRDCEPQQSVLEAASFPLVPYVNRIRDGAFRFRGRTVRLEPNMAGDPSPLHGQGWLNPWRVLSVSAQEAVLEYEHPAGEWPWAYVARQHFKLDDGALDVALSCRNLADEPMPCGLGQHPYFHCSEGTRLQTKVDHAWTIDDPTVARHTRRVVMMRDGRVVENTLTGRALDPSTSSGSSRASSRDPSRAASRDRSHRP